MESVAEKLHLVELNALTQQEVEDISVCKFEKQMLGVENAKLLQKVQLLEQKLYELQQAAKYPAQVQGTGQEKPKPDVKLAQIIEVLQEQVMQLSKQLEQRSTN